MFLGHFAVGLAGRTLTPSISLGTWFMAVQLVDLIWPLFLLAGLERVRIVPGITRFTPLDFTHYPFTHSLAAGVVWALLLGFARPGALRLPRAAPRLRSGQAPRLRSGQAAMLAGGVLSHWFLDAVVHRPDLPVLPNGPYVGLGLWNNVGATLAIELTLFVVALALYARSRRPGMSFWLMIATLLVVYIGAGFGPPPPALRTRASARLAVWLFVLWAWYSDRPVRR